VRSRTVYRIVLREGSPDFPNTSVVYDVIARKRVTKFYTAPTLARMLMRFGPANAEAHDLSSLQAMFCAGEPLNPEAWHFLYDVMGVETHRSATSGGRRSSPDEHRLLADRYDPARSQRQTVRSVAFLDPCSRRYRAARESRRVARPRNAGAAYVLRCVGR